MKCSQFQAFPNSLLPPSRTKAEEPISPSTLIWVVPVFNDSIEMGCSAECLCPIWWLWSKLTHRWPPSLSSHSSETSEDPSGLSFSNKESVMLCQQHYSLPLSSCRAVRMLAFRLSAHPPTNFPLTTTWCPWERFIRILQTPLLVLESYHLPYRVLTRFRHYLSVMWWNLFHRRHFLSQGYSWHFFPSSPFPSDVLEFFQPINSEKGSGSDHVLPSTYHNPLEKMLMKSMAENSSLAHVRIFSDLPKFLSSELYGGIMMTWVAFGVLEIWDLLSHWLFILFTQILSSLAFTPSSFFSSPWIWVILPYRIPFSSSRFSRLWKQWLQHTPKGLGKGRIDGADSYFELPEEWPSGAICYLRCPEIGALNVLPQLPMTPETAWGEIPRIVILYCWDYLFPFPDTDDKYREHQAAQLKWKQWGRASNSVVIWIPSHPSRRFDEGGGFDYILSFHHIYKPIEIYLDSNNKELEKKSSSTHHHHHHTTAKHSRKRQRTENKNNSHIQQEDCPDGVVMLYVCGRRVQESPLFFILGKEIYPTDPEEYHKGGDRRVLNCVGLPKEESMNHLFLTTNCLSIPTQVWHIKMPFLHLVPITSIAIVKSRRTEEQQNINEIDWKPMTSSCLFSSLIPPQKKGYYRFSLDPTSRISLGKDGVRFGISPITPFSSSKRRDIWAHVRTPVFFGL